MQSNSYDPVLDSNITPQKKREYWDVAFGLQEVDNLKPSRYLRELAEEHVEGKKTYYEVSDALDNYYTEVGQNKNTDEGEADSVSKAIYEILSDEAFSFDVLTYKNYHKKLFEGLNPELFHPGEFRTTNITKKEAILGGDTVQYQPFFQIESALKFDFDEERQKNYAAMTDVEKVQRIAEFTSRIWQVHPFMEGNTRTTAVFIEKYLRNIGYNVENEPFEKKAKYFRNALVRANYSNAPKGISRTNAFLVRFFENLLLGKQNDLNNAELDTTKIAK